MVSNDPIDVVLQQSVYGGDCLARLEDGRALFVALGLPGEKVRVRLTEEKRAYVRASLLEVLEPSPDRTTPRCPHFGVCGGCHYQHIPYETQLTIKQSVVEEQLQRIAGLHNPPVEMIVSSPNPWNYRNSVQFHLDIEGKTGFQASASHRVVPVHECFLPLKILEEIRSQFEFDPQSGLEKVEFRLGSDEEPLVILESNSITLPEVEVEMPVSLVHRSPAGQVVISGEDTIQFRVHDRDFLVSADSFFQVNTQQAEAMADYLLKTLPLTPDITLMDVYCGVGLFSALMAPKVKQVIGIECSPSACRDFAINLDEFEHVSLYEGLAEEVLGNLEVHPQVVIVDPPRAGLDGRVLDAIAAKRPQTLAYVSCDPSTLARDVKRLLNNGYNLVSVKPFDLFPQTYHVETISLFRPD